MPLKKLIEFLENEKVHFTRIIHSTAYTAQVIAHRAHISGNVLAKTIVLRDDGSNYLMAVVPANYQVDLEKISDLCGKKVQLSTEEEFSSLFPGCETGGMPPFGELFGLPVYVSKPLDENESISFNAGNHRELLQMSFSDFQRLAKPAIGDFARHRS